MGIAAGNAKLMLDESRKRPFGGAVLLLGRQSCSFTLDQARKWAAEQKANFREPPQPGLSLGERYAMRGFMDDTAFFFALGFDLIESCDASGWEGATHVADLNHPVPESLCGRYDLVYDGGTMEHVFNVPQVLANVHALLKPGGRIIHCPPASNAVDHGFYMFSPTLFFDYYAANKYGINACYLIEMPLDYETGPWMAYSYLPGSLRHLSWGGFAGRRTMVLFFVAEKTGDSVSGVIPQQGSYATNFWKSDPMIPGKPGTKDKVKRIVLAHFPRLYWSLVEFYSRRVKGMPPRYGSF